MTRLLFWLALVFLVIAAVRSKLRQMSGPQQDGQAPAPRQQPPAGQPTEKMLQCAHCGVHFPASENVPANGRDYCCAAHAPH